MSSFTIHIITAIVVLLTTNVAASNVIVSVPGIRLTALRHERKSHVSEMPTTPHASGSFVSTVSGPFAYALAIIPSIAAVLAISYILQVFNPRKLTIPALEMVFHTANLIWLLSMFRVDSVLGSYFPTTSTEYIFLFSYLRAGFLEELIKFLVIARFAVWGVCEKKSELIVVGTCVGGVFATFENLQHLIYGNISSSEETLVISMSRATTTTPLHISSAMLQALLILEGLKQGRVGLWMAGAVTAPVLLHGTYDFIVLAVTEGYLRGALASALFVVLYGSVAHLLSEAVEANERTELTDKLVVLEEEAFVV